MRRRILAVGAGVLVALLVGEIAIRSLSPFLPVASSWPTAEMEIKSRQLAATGEDVDVVVVGSSASDAAVNTDLLAEITGREVHNASLAAASPATNLAWLEGVVLRYAMPEIVLIGISPGPATIDAEAIARATLASARRDVNPVHPLSMVQFRGVLAEWDRRRGRERLVSSDLWTETGHVTLYYDRQASELSGQWLRAHESADHERMVAVVFEMVELVEQSGAEPVLIIEPFCCSQMIRSRSVDRYLTSVKVEADLRAVELWDLYSDGWPLDLYADPTHFNRTGTEEFTRHLAGLVGEELGSSR